MRTSENFEALKSLISRTFNNTTLGEAFRTFMWEVVIANIQARFDAGEEFIGCPVEEELLALSKFTWLSRPNKREFNVEEAVCLQFNIELEKLINIFFLFEQTKKIGIRLKQLKK